jgi:hypothetical protein
MLDLLFRNLSNKKFLLRYQHRLNAPVFRHGDIVHPDVDGYDDAPARDDLAAVQDHILRVSGWLVPDRGEPGAELWTGGWGRIKAGGLLINKRNN